MPLSRLAAGQKATIESIASECAEYICHRLHMLGFGKGRDITKIRQAPFGGPMIFQVCDVQMCLRRAQADMILVRPAPQPVSCPAADPQLSMAAA
ncbi:FeoA family protein [Cutibacterium sp.]|uniref:FeoA family protein n=1 Tax=Cutibacterium sp. TaxID=1912221 RepID=UPI0026DB06EA|nr:FeoA family protein [Cutibacterium sp.]MDO4413356.1 FeoA family protein [Cutibacterium sp.]